MEEVGHVGCVEERGDDDEVGNDVKGDPRHSVWYLREGGSGPTVENTKILIKLIEAQALLPMRGIPRLRGTG